MKDRGLRPKKRFSQNFLRDQDTIRFIVEFFEPGEGDLVLEIGAGDGTITMPLWDRGCEVRAFELERSMIALLKQRLGGRDRFWIEEGDFLKVDLPSYLKEAGRFKRTFIVGNLPYAITTAILEKVLPEIGLTDGMLLMTQLEVAKRLTANPGDSDYARHSLMAQTYSEAELVRKVLNTCFIPPPRVASALVHFKKKTPVDIGNPKWFRVLTKAAFSQRRKKLANSMWAFFKPYMAREKVNAILAECEVDPEARAQTLPLDSFVRLAHAFQREMGGEFTPLSQQNGEEHAEE